MRRTICTCLLVALVLQLALGQHPAFPRDQSILTDKFAEFSKQHSQNLQDGQLTREEAIQLFYELLEINILKDFAKEGLDFVSGSKYKTFIDSFFREHYPSDKVFTLGDLIQELIIENRLMEDFFEKAFRDIKEEIVRDTGIDFDDNAIREIMIKGQRYLNTGYSNMQAIKDYRIYTAEQR